MEAWLKHSGAVGVDAIEVADFPVTGRGVKALRSFKKGERILTIPSACLWTAEAARADPLLGPVLRSAQPPLSVEDTLAVHLLFVKSRTAGYEGQRLHIAAMPQSYSATIFFAEDELQVCEGSSLYTLTTQLEQRVQDDFRQLLVQLLSQHRDLFPLDQFTIEDYKWALCTIWSRAMDFAVSETTSVRLVAPLADMLNHSLDVKQCHAYDPTSGGLSILAAKDYQIGDQIFIYYGSVPNNRLLRLYGFVLLDNPNDSYDLVLQTSPMAPLYEQKERLWALAGLDSTCTIPLTAKHPLPKNVLRYLRIQRLDQADVADMTLQLLNGTDGKVNDGNEIQVLQFLIDSLGSLLEGFGIPLEKLEAQLVGGFYPAGGNAWAAAQVSAGEQCILTRAKKTAKDMLAAVVDPLATQCANCGNGSGALMSCGRCKAVKYCKRECQIAHFKNHKATCRTLAGAK
ncbi:kinase-like domain [Cordyceps militaris]|uniref:Kinase-like domain n=1 Tax=Cordyceps militaris TaxID=73501 RepID=A0A2H4SWF7_CORMI|nr:kinase-like domain [Cordyceps militaris]